MGCDYYIVINLYIYFNDNEYNYLTIELERHKGYYSYDDYDEDEEKLDEYTKSILRPTMKPMIIYDNESFKKISFERMYKSLVEDKINEHNKKWCDIKKIIKVERRYERN
jgi:hypothetical protein